MKKFFALFLALTCILASIPMLALTAAAEDIIVSVPEAKIAFDERGLEGYKNGDVVTVWKNSGTAANRDATIFNTSLAQPTYDTRHLGSNNYPTVWFNTGSPLYFDGTEANATASTIFVVYAAVNSGRFVYRDDSGKMLGITGRATSGMSTNLQGNYTAHSTNSANNNAFHIVAVTWDISQETNNLTYYQDGVKKYTATAYNSEFTSITDAGYSYIGGDWRNNASQYNLNGPVHCLYAYDKVLSTEELDIVGSDLATKYNLTWTGLDTANTHKHTWDAGTTEMPAGCTTDGIVNYTCTNASCSIVKQEIIPSTGHNYAFATNGDYICDNCDDKQALFEALNVAVSESFAIKFHLNAANVEHYPGYTVELSIASTSKFIKDTEKIVTYHDGDVAAKNGLYTFAFGNINPSMMTDAVTATFKDKDGVVINTVAYSIQDYAKKLNETDSELAVALFSLGAANQTYVGYDVAKLTADLTPVYTCTLSEKTPVVNNAATGATFASVNYVLDDIIKVRFLMSEAVEASSVTASKGIVTTNGKYVYVTVSMADLLDDVTVTVGESSVTCNLASFVSHKLTSEDVALKNFAAALYNFAVALDA